MKQYTLHDMNQWTDNGPLQVAKVSAHNLMDAVHKVRMVYLPEGQRIFPQHWRGDHVELWLYDRFEKIRTLELREVKHYRLPREES